MSRKPNPRIKQMDDALQALIRRIEKPEKADLAIERLNARFGSPGAIVEARIHQIEREGLSHANALLVSMLPAIVRYMGREQFGRRPKLSTLSVAADFLQTRFLGLQIEHFHLLCLDKRGKLIDSVHLQEGTVDSAPFYPRHVLAEVVRTQAHALVLSHNHPGGTMRPSQSDIECTMGLIPTLEMLRVVLLDHIVIADKQVVSFREMGYLRAGMLSPASENDPLYKNWIDKHYLD